MFRSGNTALIISNEEINNMKTVNCLEESGLLIKGVSKTIKNEAKEQKQAFLSMLLGTLGTSLLGNLKADKWTIRAGERHCNSKSGFLIPSHSWTYFEILKHYQNEPM